MTRLLCTGDLHLGQGAGLYPERLAEQEQVWRTILEHARTHDVDAVLHAGDMWERRKPTPAEMLAAERPLVEHRNADGPPVLVIAGNHDRAGEDDNLALRVLHEARLIDLSTRPDVIDVGGVSVCTLPWTPLAKLVAQSDGKIDRDTLYHDAARILHNVARDLHDQTTGRTVLLAHWALSGWQLPSGLPVDTLREVILDTDLLAGLGYDTIVAGHIHHGGLLPVPGVVLHVGSPMPLNHGEATDQHGVWILDLDHETRARFVPIDSTRFVTIDAPDVDIAVLDQTHVSDAIVRVRATVTETDEIDREEWTDLIYRLGARHVSVDVTVNRPSRARATHLDETVTVTDAFEAWLTANHIDPDQADRLHPLHRDIETACAH